MKKNSAFTLVELLIVVAIIGILMGLLAPAILKSTKAAGNRSRLVEMETLETAFLEYYHDNKGWPIPANPTAEGAKKGLNSGGEPDPRVFIYSGKDTVKVWNRLLKVGADNKFNRRKRDYFDTRSVSAIKSYNSSDPSKNILDDNLGHPADLWAADKKMSGPLVYWADFVQCPKCNVWSYDLEKCLNLDCSGRKDNSPYTFKKAERKKIRRGVMPYRIKFDLNSNLVYVLDTQE